jgi:hypothetical protein
MVFYQPSTWDYESLQAAIDARATVPSKIRQIRASGNSRHVAPCLAFECTDEGEMAEIMLDLGTRNSGFAWKLARRLRTADLRPPKGGNGTLVLFPGIPPQEQSSDPVPQPREAL